MARNPRLTAGELLRSLGERMLDIADRYDPSERDVVERTDLNDQLEVIASAVRTVPRGRGFP